MNTMNDSALWAGVADVIPQAGNDSLPTGRVAFVSVVGLASTAEEFKERVKLLFKALEFELFDLDDVHQVADDAELGKLGPELRKHVSSLSPKDPVAYGTFHAYGPDNLKS